VNEEVSRNMTGEADGINQGVDSRFISKITNFGDFRACKLTFLKAQP